MKDVQKFNRNCQGHGASQAHEQEGAGPRLPVRDPRGQEIKSVRTYQARRGRCGQGFRVRFRLRHRFAAVASVR